MIKKFLISLTALLFLPIVCLAGDVYIDGQSNEGHIIQNSGDTLSQQPVLDFKNGLSAGNVGSKTEVSADTVYLNSLYWSLITDQTGLTGDKTGSFNLTTTGTGTFGYSVINQTGDGGWTLYNAGLKIFGYDDRSGDNINIYIRSDGNAEIINEHGNMNIVSDGLIYLTPDNTLVGWFSSGGFGFYNDKVFGFGESGNERAGLLRSTVQTYPALMMGLESYATGAKSRTLLICDLFDYTFNFAHAEQANPTIFIHSAAQSTTQWLGLTHDGTNGLITSGTGTISFDNENLTTTGIGTFDKFVSTVAIGTQPYAATSTTVNTNLNADLLDGQHGTVYAPTGSIIAYAGATAPTGWLLCNAGSYLQSAYPALFAVIGTTFGGDATTFNVPGLIGNVGGNFIKGVGSGESIGSTGGSSTTADGYAAVSDSGHTHNIGVGTNVVTYSGSDQVMSYVSTVTDTGSVSVSDSGHRHDVEPINLRLNYIIKT